MMGDFSEFGRRLEQEDFGLGPVGDENDIEDGLNDETFGDSGPLYILSIL